MTGKRRTSVLLDAGLLEKARRTLKASSNTEAITKALEETLTNKEIEATLIDLIQNGKDRFVDIYR